MKKNKKLILFGDSAFAEIAYEYFTHDSEYEVCAFTVSKKFRQRDTLMGIPVIDFEEVEKRFPPDQYEMHVALVYNELNRIRKKFYEEAKSKGYHLANYISSKAFVWRNVSLGDNVFIFEDNTVQPFVKLGSNVVLWSGNHIGHHSTLGSHIFISSHVVISGFCKVGDSCFMGVNAAVGNNLNIGKDCIIGSGALIVKDVPDGSLVKGSANFPDEKSIYDKLNIKPE